MFDSITSLIFVLAFALLAFIYLRIYGVTESGLIWPWFSSGLGTESSWSSWKDPSKGAGEGVHTIVFSCLFVFSQTSFTHSSTFSMFLHLIVKDKTNCYMFKPSRQMAGFHHLLVKLNHTNHSPGTRVLIYSSRQACQVYIQLLKSNLPLSASSAASPMLNCFTDEKHNAVTSRLICPLEQSQHFLDDSWCSQVKFSRVFRPLPSDRGVSLLRWSLRPEACSSFHWWVQMVRSHAIGIFTQEAWSVPNIYSHVEL